MANTGLRRIALVTVTLGGVAACGGGGGSIGSAGQSPTAPASCASPLPVQAMDYTLTVDVPSDFDASASPTPTPTTDIGFTVLLPRRCPGDQFPLVVQSHGYSGTRQRSAAASAALDPTVAHFESINQLVRGLPHRGYVVISYDERGHGVARPGQAAHNARIIDPAAETQDAIAILDWAYDNPTLSFAQREDTTGIAKDLRVGTIGYSYGGGFEMPLALLDARVDTIVPNGTWNNLLYSLLPGDAVKLGYASLLGSLAIQGNVNNTPLAQTLFNLAGPAGPGATTLRTRTDLFNAATSPAATPRALLDEDEGLNFFYTHGTRWFEQATRDGKAIGARDTPPVTRPASLRPVPALFLQGNRDVLFNLTDAYFNYIAFKGTGADVRLLSTEGGHMNPLAQQNDGSANCGGVVGVEAIVAWFDAKLKNLDSATYQDIPQVCISITDTPAPAPSDPNDHVASPTNDRLVAVRLADMPVGSLSGTGAIAAQLASGSVSVLAGMGPVFLPVATIAPAQTGAVIAGIPRVGRVSVRARPESTITPLAIVGVAVRRNGVATLLDDEATAFAALPPAAGTTDCADAPLTDHCHNRGTGNGSVLLAGVGEQLLPGDEVGLLFFENQVQYLPANNAGTAAQQGLPNPHDVVVTDVELPILLPCPNSAGCYPGSSLSLP